MTLSLATPTGAITTFDNGMVAVRCFDYPGAARGTLTTPTDSKSVAGDVISDEQTLAVQTTFTASIDMWEAAADSVVIPLADLGLVDGIEYDMYVGARITGDAPANAQARSTWLTYDRTGASVGFGVGFDSGVGFWQSPVKVARERIGEYLLYYMSFWDHGDLTPDNFIVRGWGITGGDVAVLLDMVYFIPETVWDESLAGLTGDEALFYNADDERALRFNFNGAVDADQDDAAGAVGDRTVLDLGFPWMEADGIVDVQDANDEPTVVDLHSNGFWDDDPPSMLAIVAGAIHVAPETLTVEDFDQPDSGNNPQWENADGLVSGMGPGTLNPGPFPDENGWRFEGGLARCYINSLQGVPAYANMTLFHGFVTPGGSGTDPRDGRMTLDTLSRGAVLTCRVRCDTTQEQAVELGFNPNSVSPQDRRVARLDLDGSDSATLSLITGSTRISASPVSIFTIDGPVSVLGGYTVGDWFWIKVQVRGYHWRARVWLDGDTEPSTWDVEGFMPLEYRNSGNTVKGWLAYPWDWASLGANGDVVVTDPRFGTTTVTYDEGGVALLAWVGASQPSDSLIECNQVTAAWEPDGNSPDDMHVEVEKYDGTVTLDSAITVPYGPHRVVLGDMQTRRFSGDTHGFNIRAWKNSGSPVLQTSGLGHIYERRRHVVFRPQIYRRVLG